MDRALGAVGVSACRRIIIDCPPPRKGALVADSFLDDPAIGKSNAAGRGRSLEAPPRGISGRPACQQLAALSEPRLRRPWTTSAARWHTGVADWVAPVSPPITKRNPRGSNPPSTAILPLRVISAFLPRCARPYPANGHPGHRFEVQGDHERRPRPDLVFLGMPPATSQPALDAWELVAWCRDPNRSPHPWRTALGAAGHRLEVDAGSLVGDGDDGGQSRQSSRCFRGGSCLQANVSRVSSGFQPAGRSVFKSPSNPVNC